MKNTTIEFTTTEELADQLAEIRKEFPLLTENEFLTLVLRKGLEASDEISAYEEVQTYKDRKTQEDR